MPGHEPQLPDAGTDSASHFSLNHPSLTSISLRNPLPLSAAQEMEVKKLYYARVRRLCDPEIAAFAACARGRTFSTTWTCRETQRAMNSCMIRRAGPEEEDAAREEWFRGIRERRRQREEEAAEVERRRGEVIEVTRRRLEKEEMERGRREGEEKGEKNEGTKKGWLW